MALETKKNRQEGYEKLKGTLFFHAKSKKRERQRFFKPKNVTQKILLIHPHGGKVLKANEPKWPHSVKSENF